MSKDKFKQITRSISIVEDRELRKILLLEFNDFCFNNKLLEELSDDLKNIIYNQISKL